MIIVRIKFKFVFIPKGIETSHLKIFTFQKPFKALKLQNVTTETSLWRFRLDPSLMCHIHHLELIKVDEILIPWRTHL